MFPRNGETHTIWKFESEMCGIVNDGSTPADAQVFERIPEELTATQAKREFLTKMGPDGRKFKVTENGTEVFLFWCLVYSLNFAGLCDYQSNWALC